MSKSVAFQTRARTIDHLGREQIADVPTAVSELWKNAYDAYAREVALHIHGGEHPVGVITDDGHGMTAAQFIDKWLVVGTESKAGNDDIPVELRNGLPLRPKQGQKGIGRLSVAALGSTVLVVSKQIGKPYVCCLIDWRLFENPYLLMQDITLPVLEFDNPSQLAELVPGMVIDLLENLDGSSGSESRASRLKSAWEEFDSSQSVGGLLQNSPSEQIREALNHYVYLDKYLSDWGVWCGKAKSGSAMIMTELNATLEAWVIDPRNMTDEVESMRASLVRTLSGFSDPYVKASDVLDYKVVVHGSDDPKIVVGASDGFGIEYLHTLDHCIEGDVDEYGVFRGRVRAFGKFQGEVELTPSHPLPTAPRERVGPFSICLGTYEGNPRSSTLPPSIHAQVVNRAESLSGLNIYRDGLRVMPYGRPENDFFKIEERRQMNAGREFWASRRSFGRIALTRSHNPNLRDKAGREGVIDNTASRAIQMLVVDLLKVTARRYFGSDYEHREDLIEEIQAENDAAASKAKSARSGQLNSFRKTVRELSPLLTESIVSLASVTESLKEIIARDNAEELWAISSRVEALQDKRADLKLPPKPKNLGKFEERYREYRQGFSEFSEKVESLKNLWALETERLSARPAIDIARSKLSSNQKFISDRLIRWRRGILDSLKSEIERIDSSIDNDQKEFYKKSAPLLSDLEAARTPLRVVLNEMDKIRDDLVLRFSEQYDPYTRSLRQLSEGVDLDGVFAYAGARTETLEKKLEQIEGLAQIGVSVEILSHELHSLDRRLEVGLKSLPENIHAMPAYIAANDARVELVERLGFLSKLQVSGSDIKQEITGANIETYLRAFFGGALESASVTLAVTEEFKNIRFTEYPSRIFPVFINLVNNSLYWVSNRNVRTIQLAVLGEVIVLSDTGPGIDQDDIDNLFELFFTRRVRGRGVGLYLCKQTLAAGGHKISYVEGGVFKLLPGANFTITLRNGFDV